MRYEHIYYKNLCEQLEERIQILQKFLSEAGLRKALKTGKKELLAKEAMKQGERRKRKLAKVGEMGREIFRSPASSGEAAVALRKQQTANISAGRLGSNIEEIDMQLDVIDPELRSRTSALYMQLPTLPNSGSYQY
jgi:hypothetical protein